MKGEKADKPTVDAEIKALLALKSEFKQTTGKDWVTGSTPTQASLASHFSGDVNIVLQNIAEQGDKIRDIKSKKADKATIDSEVKVYIVNSILIYVIYV